MSVPRVDQTITDSIVRNIVVTWFRALDRHDDLEDVLAYLDPEAFELRLPMETRHGLGGFRAWYEAVTHRFFDEQHRVTGVRITPSARWADHVTVVDVRVNWQARTWRPPAAHSCWIGFDAHQTWHLVAGPDGRLVVRTYIVKALDPMPGSADI
jgi:hypothetical protein